MDVSNDVVEYNGMKHIKRVEADDFSTSAGVDKSLAAWGRAIHERDQFLKDLNEALIESHQLKIAQGQHETEVEPLVASNETKQTMTSKIITANTLLAKERFMNVLLERSRFHAQLRGVVDEIKDLKLKAGAEGIAPATNVNSGGPDLISFDSPQAPSTHTGVAEAPAVTPPAADTQGAPASALQTIAVAANAPAAAVTGDIAALTEELKKVNEELDVEKRKNEALRNVCQEHENTIKGLRVDPDHQKVLIDRHKADLVILEKERDKYRSLCTRIEGIMKYEPSTTQDVADLMW
jgi:hypothetical protein